MADTRSCERHGRHLIQSDHYVNDCTQGWLYADSMISPDRDSDSREEGASIGWADETPSGDTITLWLCVDCTTYAHGFSEHETGTAYPSATIDAFNDPARGLAGNGNLTPGGLDTHTGDCISDEDGNVYPVDDCTCDHIDFTWNRCDGCLSSLGGIREAFTLWF